MTLIIKEIVSRSGTDESSKVELVADTESGKTWIEISKTITERHPITSHDDVMKLFNDINRGGGRRRVTLKDMTK